MNILNKMAEESLSKAEEYLEKAKEILGIKKTFEETWGVCAFEVCPHEDDEHKELKGKYQYE